MPLLAAAIAPPCPALHDAAPEAPGASGEASEPDAQDEGDQAEAERQKRSTLWQENRVLSDQAITLGMRPWVLRATANAHELELANKHLREQIGQAQAEVAEEEADGDDA